nr:MAG TPA: FliS export chaperone FliS [Caudoviricetes sp.]
MRISLLLSRLCSNLDHKNNKYIGYVLHTLYIFTYKKLRHKSH